MVGKIKIIITYDVILYLDNLIQILYKEGYFGFLKTAEQYVSNIYNHISENLSSSRQYSGPKELRHLGKFYIFYRANKRTTWYIFFEKRDQQYLITSILNNHCKEARFLRQEK